MKRALPSHSPLLSRLLLLLDLDSLVFFTLLDCLIITMKSKNYDPLCSLRDLTLVTNGVYEVNDELGQMKIRR